MGCKNCSENSSTTYTRCPDVVSTNCVFYQGNSLECPADTSFSICKGDNMTSVQTEIFNRICQLIGDTNVSTVLIPNCLKDAWATEDKTILNLFNFVLQNQCDLQEQLAEATSTLSTLNPTVTIKNVDNCYTDCTDCTVELTLSGALNKIITEICNLKAVTTDLQSQLDATNKDLRLVKTDYEKFNTFIKDKTCQIDNLTAQVTNLTIRINNAGTIPPCGTDCVPVIVCP